MCNVCHHNHVCCGDVQADERAREGVSEQVDGYILYQKQLICPSAHVEASCWPAAVALAGIVFVSAGYGFANLAMPNPMLQCNTRMSPRRKVSERAGRRAARS